MIDPSYVMPSHVVSDDRPGPRMTAPPPPGRGTRLRERIPVSVEWRDQALCKLHKQKHWYPITPSATSYDYARTICQRCPVIEPCRQEAERYDDPCGMWAGLTPKERGFGGPTPPPRGTVVPARTPWARAMWDAMGDLRVWSYDELTELIVDVVPREVSLQYAQKHARADRRPIPRECTDIVHKRGVRAIAMATMHNWKRRSRVIPIAGGGYKRREGVQ